MIDVERLLLRGDRLSIDRGRLRVLPASGKFVPNDWLKKHERQVATSILEKLNMDALVYVGFDKGVFQGKYEGIHLQFESLLTGASRYCLFNAEVKYIRGPKAGRLLPGRQFRVGSRSDFLKFWRRAGLKLPSRRGSFHDYMGNLKPFIFTARQIKSERLEKQTLSLLTVSQEQVLAAYLDALPDITQTDTILKPNKRRTTLPYKEVRQSQNFQGLAPNESTVDLNHGTRLIGSAVIRERVNPTRKVKKLPEEQTVDEWLADYEGTENLKFH